jgi:ubiquinone/menaquinone biosynthesis C-methylase UbiE
MPETKPFDENIDKYEQWFIDNKFVYESELEAIKQLIPEGNGLEIGVGSGIFALPLGIKNGVDPSNVMLNKAQQRGINVKLGVAENLPYPDENFDFAIMVTTICFVDDVLKALTEANRVIKKNGSLIIAFIDKNSAVGKQYLKNKEKSTFFKYSNFYNTDEVYNFLKTANFKITETIQTIFGDLGKIKEIQRPQTGFGKGSFVVIKARKF